MSLVEWDDVLGFNKGGYAIATSVERDASLGTTNTWIKALPTDLQSFFVSAYLPLFTEDWPYTAYAALTIAAATTPIVPSTIGSSPSVVVETAFITIVKTATVNLLTYTTNTALRRELQEEVNTTVTPAHAASNDGMIISIVVPLLVLTIFGLGFMVFCCRRSRRAPTVSNTSDSPSDTSQIYHDDANNSAPFFDGLNETATTSIPKDRSAELPAAFSTSESSVPRSRMHSQHFELGSSLETSSSEAESSTHFISPDDPCSDTAFISSLAREATPIPPPSSAHSGNPIFDSKNGRGRRASLSEEESGRLHNLHVATTDHNSAAETELRATRSTGDITRGSSAPAKERAEGAGSRNGYSITDD
jgi:hypothetical protein